MFKRPPYTGSRRKLVLGIDVGTTFCGMSYAILDPGQVPEIQGVNRYPAQDHIGGDSKIPTVIYYDSEGKPRAIGAEALQLDIIQQAKTEGWTKVEWCKLHFRPDLQSHLPPLPPGKTIVDVFGDIFNYLFSCAKTYIQESHANAESLWSSMQADVHFVITHPNGWEGYQQGQIRQAAILAGMIQDTLEGHNRVELVTEGEASLNYCIQKGLITKGMQNGEGIVIVDAGGGTVDISTYYVALRDKTFEEIAIAQCHFQGSAFITQRAVAFFQKKFDNTPFAVDVEEMQHAFDTKTKLTFRNPKTFSYVKFGTVRDNDPALGIDGGILKIPGTRMEEFFHPSIDCILLAVLQLKGETLKPISTVYLVGGYAASDWLYQCLQIGLKAEGLHIYRPDGHTNKAVADGAVSFYLDRFVGKRVAKFHYGAAANIHFRQGMKSHQRRSQKMIIRPSGSKLLPGVFEPIVNKGTQVTETQEFRRDYYREANSLDDLKSIVADIWCYRGSIKNPRWIDMDPGMFSVLCRIEADTSRAPKEQHKGGAKGKGYYVLDYTVILLFGPTELKAQIAWNENGKEKRGPAKIVYGH